ncbi:MAG: homoserine O-acetyltransferase/O-succinyltransferase family protein [Christensenellales bacterium]
MKFDGLVVTGAGRENGLYRRRVLAGTRRIMEWASTNVYSSMYICWAAQAAA